MTKRRRKAIGFGQGRGMNYRDIRQVRAAIQRDPKRTWAVEIITGIQRDLEEVIATGPPSDSAAAEELLELVRPRVQDALDRLPDGAAT